MAVSGALRGLLLCLVRRQLLGGRFIVLKNVFDARAENPGDPKGQWQGRSILSNLNGDDALSGNAGANGQLLLGHFTLFEAETPDPVLDISLRHRASPGRKGPEW